MCGLKKLASGVFPESWKCWQNGDGVAAGGSGGENGPKTRSPPVYPGWLNYLADEREIHITKTNPFLGIY